MVPMQQNRAPVLQKMAPVQQNMEPVQQHNALEDFLGALCGFGLKSKTAFWMLPGSTLQARP